MDRLRKQYADYLWDGEFRDTQGATVTVQGTPFSTYSVFRGPDARRAVVLVNPSAATPIQVDVAFEGTAAGVAGLGES